MNRERLSDFVGYLEFLNNNRMFHRMDNSKVLHSDMTPSNLSVHAYSYWLHYDKITDLYDIIMFQFKSNINDDYVDTMAFRWLEIEADKDIKSIFYDCDVNLVAAITSLKKMC